MAPAFSSWRQALAFALLLLIILVLPAVMDGLGVLSRSDAYAAMPESTGPYSFIQREIFVEKSDLDIVFIGPSAMLAGVDTPYVQKALTARIGREAKVITLASLYEGEDRNYLLVRDLLQHRKVKMVVLSMLSPDTFHYDPHAWDGPYTYDYRLFQMGQNSEALAGLPFADQVSLYAGAVLGLPRHLLSLARPNLLETSRYTGDLGAGPLRENAPGSWAPFVPYAPPPPRLEPAAMILSASTRSVFRPSNDEPPRFQRVFERKIGQLLSEHDVRLVLLNIPSRWDNARADMDIRVIDSPETFGVPAEIVGVPPAQLFAGLTDAEIRQLCNDHRHFNANGSAYFTRVIAPALLELYAQAKR